MASRRIISVSGAAVLVSVGLFVPQAAQAGPAVVANSHAGAAAKPVAAQPAAKPVSLLGGPGVWTKISNGTGGGFNEPGLLRTKDGKLHVVWVKQNKPNDMSVGYSTISLTGSLLNMGVAVPHWANLQTTPRLVPDGNKIRLVFNGGQDGNASNKFSLGARYTETSPNGTSWTLVNGSLSSQTVFNQSNLSATTEANGTPVSTEGLNSTIFYHVGVDAAIPSNTQDKQIDGQGGTGLNNAQLMRDKDGSIWASWYQRFGSKQGYYVEKLLPAKGPQIKAPNSGNQNLQDNEPGQQVAFAARVGGGLYLAYCQETKTFGCARIVVWKVGSKTPRIVPGSSGGSARKVTLSAGAKGRLVVGWYDATKNVIHVVRTNTHATAWGVERTIAAPPKTLLFDSLFSESSSGRIDLVANVLQAKTGNPIGFFHTQVLEGLKVTASPTKFSHLHSATISFKVTDAGEAVANATVSFLGHKAHTNSKGIAKISIAKGQKKGTKTATASKSLYYKATVSVKIT